jgi:hypothetical protein
MAFSLQVATSFVNPFAKSLTPFATGLSILSFHRGPVIKTIPVAMD